MIQILDSPDNVVAFRAVGEITKEDYQNIVEPTVEGLIERIDEINFLLLLDTDLENFTASAWMQDVLMGLKNLVKWNRSAIVTDSDKIISFTNGFSYIVPGEFRGFKKDSFDKALSWVQGNDAENTNE